MNTEEDWKLQWWSVAALNLFFGTQQQIQRVKTSIFLFFLHREELYCHCCTWCVCVRACVCSITDWFVCKWSVSSLRLMHCQFDRPTTHHSVLCHGSCDSLSPEAEDFYLIVSSLPLNCWNLLWRFLICSSVTEKREQKPTARRKVCHWNTHTIMIIIFKPHPQKYNCPFVVITGGGIKAMHGTWQEINMLVFSLSLILNTLGLQVDSLCQFLLKSFFNH